MSTRPPSQRIAVISDIHGNLLALDAVLADIARRGIERIVNLGDSFYGPLDPAGTAACLLAHDIPAVRGNEDRILLNRVDESATSPTLRYVLSQLDAEAIDWLGSLPHSRVAYDEFFLCHGTPSHDDEYLLEEVANGGIRQRDPDEVAQMLDAIDRPVILCGHSHLPRTVELPDGRLVVNPGSVGLQAFTDTEPTAHAVQTGTPDARYAIVTRTDTGWHTLHVSLSYDARAAAKLAMSNDRADWAAWLLSGTASADFRPQ